MFLILLSYFFLSAIDFSTGNLVRIFKCSNFSECILLFAQRSFGGFYCSFLNNFEKPGKCNDFTPIFG